MKKISVEAKTRYSVYIKDYKLAIDAILEREKKLKELAASEAHDASYQKLALADENLNIVSNYVLMSSLSQTFLGVKNDGYLNEARKCIYKAIIYLEEVLGSAVDVPFSEYEEALARIEAFSDEARYDMVRKLGFSIDAIKEGFGDNSKWRWSFVELEGRYAAVTKNLLNLKTLLARLDPREEGYGARVAHLTLAKTLLQQAADRYREKYELSTMRLDDIKLAISFLAALRRLHVLLGEVEQAEVVRKKGEIWKAKMDDDQKKLDAKEELRR